jgi:hypothetical protein
MNMETKDTNVVKLIKPKIKMCRNAGGDEPPLRRKSLSKSLRVIDPARNRRDKAYR